MHYNKILSVNPSKNIFKTLQNNLEMLKPKLTKHLFELEALKTSKKCDFQSFNSSENEIKELIDRILLQIQIFLDSNKKRKYTSETPSESFSRIQYSFFESILSYRKENNKENIAKLNELKITIQQRIATYEKKLDNDEITKVNEQLKKLVSLIERSLVSNHPSLFPPPLPTDSLDIIAYGIFRANSNISPPHYYL